jgi:hypothetical protein
MIGNTVHGDSLVVERRDEWTISLYSHEFLLGNLLEPANLPRCDGSPA